MSIIKRIAFVFAFLVVVLGLLGGIKALQIRKMIASASGFKPPAETITTATASAAAWAATLTAVGSLAAVRGVTVSAEMPGKVAQISFRPGAMVGAGAILLRQDTSAERAQLRAAEARLTLARSSLERVERLFVRHVVAASQLDDARAQLDQVAAEADAIRVAIQQKTIRAPFAGRLGIRLVNLGQVLASGAPIVSLQAIDPIFANFSLPQQQLDDIQTGQTVRLKTSTREFSGTITAISPSIDTSTRNVEVQATVANAGEWLRPGMFVDVTVMLPARKKVLAIPAPAVLYAPYGDSVFVVQQADRTTGHLAAKGIQTVKQQFVRLGERRGDYVAVLGGVKEGQTVASSGVFKLRNGQTVLIDNTLSPRFKLAPTPSDS